MTREQKVSFCKEMAERCAKDHEFFVRAYKIDVCIFWMWVIAVAVVGMALIGSILLTNWLLVAVNVISASLLWRLRPEQYPEYLRGDFLEERQYWLEQACHIEQFGDTDVVD